jgi:hypothetical protein
MKIINIFQNLTNMTIFAFYSIRVFILTTQIGVSYISKFEVIYREWVFKEIIRNFTNLR